MICILFNENMIKEYLSYSVSFQTNKQKKKKSNINTHIILLNVFFFISK